MQRLRKTALAALAGLSVATLSACSGGDGGRLDAGKPGQTCLVHQHADPAPKYRGGENAKTADVLAFLGYYTAHGNQRFCDGKPATAHDRVWVALYTELSGSPENVRTVATGSPR